MNQYIYKQLNRLIIAGQNTRKMEIYDVIEKTARKVIRDSKEILETKEILEQVQSSLGDVTRTKLFSRLNNLRGNGVIKGKFVGPGKGVWIWWDGNLFAQHENFSDDSCLGNQSVSEEAKNESK